MKNPYHVTKKRKISIRLFFLLSLIIQASAFAAFPFITNDPVPAPYKHWKLYYYGTVDHSPNGTNIPAPSVEIDYGAIPNLHLHMIVTGQAFLPSNDIPDSYGFGDTEVGVKYRFIQETKDSPQVAIYPLAKLPTGDARHGLGNGRVRYKLPIWIQKSWGSWTAYGGGGYLINSVPGTDSHFYGGCVIQRALNAKLTLGSEIFSQGRSAVNIPSFTLLNLGGSYKLTQHLSFLFSVGHSILGQQNTVGFVGLYWTGIL